MLLPRLVTSFGGNDSLRRHSPTIMAIAQPVETLAETLINVLLEKLRGDHPAPLAVQEIVWPLVLVVRHSSVRQDPR
ncbi:MAG: hypothetical protein EOO56_04425 [Hymenobacter sp.]|nr:MAG: hypothetical protein EOO56_04425 [Hymenobacter sp.]